MLDLLYTKHNKALQNIKTSFKSNLHNKIHWNERLIGIKGARGVGKTTLILQHISEQHGNDLACLYVSLDDIAFPYENLVQLAEDFERTGGKYLFLDEIHKYHNWSQELKNIYDSLPSLKVVFSGSSILDILKGKADLSRRAVVYRMQGLSFREFLQIKTGQDFESFTLKQLLKNHVQLSKEVNARVKPFQYFNDYLHHGYYPYFLENIENYHYKLSNTLSLTIETDMPLLLNVDTKYVGKLKKFLNILSSNIPFKPNVSNLAAAIGVSWQSVIHYLHYLHEAEMIRLVYHEGKDISSLSKPEMIYLHHPNLFFVFTDEVKNRESLREAFFVNQLSYGHRLEKADRGDFVINGKHYFEVGGKNKTYHQIADIKDCYVAADDLEFGFKNKIPLWMFGFLY